ncbi:MAG: hypothetical protein ACK4NC_02735 [Candidatus Gracilibacteria bacterium]
MKKGIGFFSFIFGTVLGGIFALFTAKRKGSEVRKDFYQAIKNKDNLSDLLLQELKGLGDEAKKIATEVRSSELVEEYKEMANEKFEDLYKQAQKKMLEMRTNFEDQWEELRVRFEEGKEEVKAEAMTEGKALAAKANKTVNAAKNKATTAIKKTSAKPQSKK